MTPPSDPTPYRVRAAWMDIPCDMVGGLVLGLAACGGAAMPAALCPLGAADAPEIPVLPADGIDAYLGVGYLTHDAGDAYGNPSCGATLVHARVALTAVHCVERALATPIRCTPGEGLVYVDLATHQSFVSGVIAEVEAGGYPRR